MAAMTETYPPATAYDDRSIQAVKAVLLEIGQILGSYRNKFVVIGGAVPWLLLDNPQMRHIGSLDIDLSLDPIALGHANSWITKGKREPGPLMRNSPARCKGV